MTKPEDILFVGQAPSRSSTVKDTDDVLLGQIGKRICALCGQNEAWLKACGRVNLNFAFSGKNGKGDAFDWKEGIETAAVLQLRKRNVMLGFIVEACFKVNVEILTEFTLRERSCLLVPHPSSINWWWNLPSNHSKAARALRKFLA